MQRQRSALEMEPVDTKDQNELIVAFLSPHFPGWNSMKELFDKMISLYIYCSHKDTATPFTERSAFSLTMIY